MALLARYLPPSLSVSVSISSLICGVYYTEALNFNVL